MNRKKFITKIRGEYYDCYGTKLIPTIDPAYLRRDASEKREVSEDMKIVRALSAGKN